MVPGPMLPPILDSIEARGLRHSLKRVVIFFATPELLDRATKLLGRCGATASARPSRAPSRRGCRGRGGGGHRRLASVGRAASPFIEVAVVDEQGGRVPPVSSARSSSAARCRPAATGACRT